MNTKHTPGPWAYVCDDQETPGQFKGYIQGDIGGCIAQVWPDRETPTGQANAEANARLIAAAPEMYKLLHQIWSQTDPSKDPKTCKAISTLLGAIDGLGGES